jgi:hypothetical protein
MCHGLKTQLEASTTETGTSPTMPYAFQFSPMASWFGSQVKNNLQTSSNKSKTWAIRWIMGTFWQPQQNHTINYAPSVTNESFSLFSYSD